jgi:hypothetical protein
MGGMYRACGEPWEVAWTFHTDKTPAINPVGLGKGIMRCAGKREAYGRGCDPQDKFQALFVLVTWASTPPIVARGPGTTPSAWQP